VNSGIVDCFADEEGRVQELHRPVYTRSAVYEVRKN